MARKKILSLQQKVDAQLETFVQQTEARFQIAKRLYDHQDAETRAALNIMVERIVSISTGLISIQVKGEGRVAARVPADAMQKNAMYLATEIFKDLAMLDIRVANFRFDPRFCAQCGKPVKVKKKVKK
jgi:hypothetical protein